MRSQSRRVGEGQTEKAEKDKVRSQSRRVLHTPMHTHTHTHTIYIYYTHTHAYTQAHAHTHTHTIYIYI